MAIDPLVSLASAIQSANGAYALLLGSGISRSAQIPTGWEIVSELARRTAVAAEEDPGEDPITWYAARFGGDADYSSLLTQLAPGPGDRRNLLEPFFVPSEEDRAAGKKIPTAGHRAIASLVADGYVKVIVTTNFDRLLEIALSEAGVQPQVIDSAGAARGALPLHHAAATVVKVHGDYLSPNFKNTVDELATYETEIDALLDEIFDRYGLIICGWSGDWDKALRDAILRIPSRRYATYWCHVGPLGEQAQRVAAEREAIELEIAGADSLFEGLRTKIQLLEEMGESGPITTSLAIAELKRYLPEPTNRIRLHDFMAGETRLTLEAIGLDQFPVDSGLSPQPSPVTVVERMTQYEARMVRPLHLLATGGYFGDVGQQSHWERMLLAIDNRPVSYSGWSTWASLQRYPTVLAAYVIGLAGIAQKSPLTFLRLSSMSRKHEFSEEVDPLVDRFVPESVVDDAGFQMLIRVNQVQTKMTTFSDRVHGAVMPVVRDFFHSDAEFDEAFDALEYLIGLIKFKSQPGWAPWGRYRHGRFNGPVDRPPNIDGLLPALVASGAFESEGEVAEVAGALSDYFRKQPFFR